MKDQPEPWQRALKPGDRGSDTVTDTEVVIRFKAWLVHSAVKTKNKRAGQALWYVVSWILRTGCTTATEWCVAAGLDPHMRVKVKV